MTGWQLMCSFLRARSEACAPTEAFAGGTESVFTQSTVTLCSLPLKIALQLMSVRVANQA